MLLKQIINKINLNKIIIAFIVTWLSFICTALITSIFGMLNNIFLYSFVWIANMFLFVFILRKNLNSAFFQQTTDDNAEGNKIINRLAIYSLLVVFGLNLITSLYFMPSNYDSLTYHLPRIFFYYSQESLEHFYTTNDRQIFSPFNATLFQMFVVQYNLPHQFFNLINLWAWTTIIFLLYKMTLLFGFGKTTAILVSWFGAMADSVLAQATTTNNDILVGVALLSTIYFLFSWFKYKDNFLLALAILSAGITLGTKVTVVYLLPGVLIFIFIKMIKFSEIKNFILENKHIIKSKLLWASLLISGIVATASLLINFSEKGTLSAPSQSVYINKSHNIKAMMQNAIGISVQSTMQPSTSFYFNTFKLLDKISGKTYKNTIPFYVNKVINDKFIDRYWERKHSMGTEDFLNRFISVSLVEDEIWYGFATYLIIFSILIFVRRRKNYLDILAYFQFLFFISFAYFISYILLMKWQPWSCRFFVPTYLLLASFIAFFVESNINKKIKNLTLLLFGLIIFWNGLNYIAYNYRRPLMYLADKKTVFDIDILPEEFNFLHEKDSINIVWSDGQGGDAVQYLFMTSKKRQYLRQSPKILPTYFNLIAVSDTTNINNFVVANREQFVYIGNYQYFWFYK